jgi:hypothetical protein
MKYKIGQKVRIREDINQGLQVPFGITSEMEKMAGKVVTIKDAQASYDGNDCYTIDKESDRMGWSWSEECFTNVEMNADEAFNALLKGQLTDEEYEAICRERG